MNELAEHTKLIRTFLEEREWGQRTSPKDMAVSLVLEAGEVLEQYQWIKDVDVPEHGKKYKDDIAEELADTYYWILSLCDKLDIDLDTAFKAKMIKNAAKYPPEKVKGKSTNVHTHKYTNL